MSRLISGRFRVFMTIALAVVFLPIVASAEDLTAEQILELSNRRAGVACVWATGDKLPVELARASQLVVCAIGSENAALAQVRADGAAAGLLGRRLYVVQTRNGHVPLASGMVDLVVMREEGGITPDEAARLVSPGRGRVVALGPSAVDEQRADAAGLEAHDAGLFSRPMPRGADDWSHYQHGPDNNPVSGDYAFTYPYLTQWFAKPYNHLESNCSVLMSGGRIFIMERAYFAWEGNNNRHNIFCALSSRNGELIWKRNLPVKYKSGFSNLVATPDKLYMLLGSGIVHLDAETGVTLKEVALEGVTGHGKWLGMVDGRAVVLVGEADSSVEFPEPDAKLSNRAVSKASQEVSTEGKLIVACDPETGNVIWRHEMSAPVESRMIAVSGGRVIYFAEPKHVGALDLATGDVLWTNADGDLIELIKEDSKKITSLGGTTRGITAQADVALIGSFGSKGMAALDTESGNVLWRKVNAKGQDFLHTGRLVQYFIMDDELWTKGKVYDLRTGEMLRRVPALGGGCGQFTASANYVCAQFGLSYDVVSGKTMGQLSNMLKTPCNFGTIIADGVYFWPSGSCTCDLPLRGYRVAAPAGDFEFNTSGQSVQRLVRGSGALTTADPVQPRDWPTRRGNHSRSASTQAAVPGQPALVATYEPAHPFRVADREPEYEVEHRPSVPVAVGDHTFFGNTDGRIVCLDTTTAEVAWEFTTEGRVLGAPEYWKGRIYAGCADGYVYALDATNGGLLWKFRVPAQDRRIMIFGELMSTWPVLSGVLVHAGMVYAAAGHAPEDGAYVVALDAETGELNWEHADLANRPDMPLMGRVPVGDMTVAADKLWLQCANYAYTAFDLETGEMEPLIEPMNDERQRQGRLGQELGVMDGWLIYGGQRRLSDQAERSGARLKIARWAGVQMARLADNGLPEYPEVCPSPRGLALPSWDAGLVVGPLLFRSKLEAWDKDRFAAWRDAKFKKGQELKFPRHRQVRVALPVPLAHRGDVPEYDMTAWRDHTMFVSAVVLAPNAVLVAGRSLEGRQAPWNLSARNRESGEVIWSVKLPAEPVYEGICVDRHGRIIVTLIDGRALVYGTGK